MQAVASTTAARIETAKAFLAAVDCRGDLSRLVTDDVRITFPKWGVCEGVADFQRYFTDLGSYIAEIRHLADSFEITADDERVVIEGLSSGELMSGARWPNGLADGRFSTTFKFVGDRISEVRIYIDPDYVDATAEHYSWRRQGEAA